MTSEHGKKISESQTGNQRGFGKKNKMSSSTYHGISFDNTRKKWRCYFQHKNKQHYGGYFDDEIDAAKAYNEYCVKNNLDRPLNKI